MGRCVAYNQENCFRDHTVPGRSHSCDRPVPSPLRIRANNRILYGCLLLNAPKRTIGHQNLRIVSSWGPTKKPRREYLGYLKIPLGEHWKITVSTKLFSHVSTSEKVITGNQSWASTMHSPRYQSLGFLNSFTFFPHI